MRVPVFHSLVTSQARSCEIVVAIVSVWNVDTDDVDCLTLGKFANIESRALVCITACA